MARPILQKVTRRTGAGLVILLVLLSCTAHRDLLSLLHANRGYILLSKVLSTDHHGAVWPELGAWGEFCMASQPRSRAPVQRPQLRLARREFERSSVWNANASEAFRGLGTVDLMEANPAGAVGALATASQLGGTPIVRYQLGCAHASNGDRESALAVWRTVPQVTAVFVNRGALHLQDGRLGQALRCYETAAEIALTPLVAYRMGELYRKLGRLDDALAAYRLLADYGMSRVTLFPCASCTRPALSLAYEGEGQIAGARGDWHKAVLAFEEALQFERANASLLSQLGWARYKDTQDVDSARGCFLAATRLNPSFVWPELRLGDMYRAEGRYEEARAAYVRAVQIDPDHSYAHYRLGTLLHEMGDLAGAIVELEYAVQFGPTDKWYGAALCDVYRELGLTERIEATCPSEADDAD